MDHPENEDRCTRCRSWEATAARVRTRRSRPPGAVTGRAVDPGCLRVLLVCGDEAEADGIARTLSGPPAPGFRVDRAWDLDEALSRVRAVRHDGILLDLALPDAPGTEGVRQLTRSAPETPLVALTPGDDDGLAIEVLRLGAQDGVVRGCRDRRGLERALRYAVERKRTERLLCFMAYHDSLTGLPNRALLDDRLRHAVARAERSQRPLAVLFVDLDGFKTVNDLHGHAEGDRLLVRVANRLAESVRRVDTVARIGGDEFAVLMPEITAERHARIAARRLAGALSRLGVRASIGAGVFPRDARDPESLLRAADAAMYEDRRRRRGLRGQPAVTVPPQRRPA